MLLKLRNKEKVQTKMKTFTRVSLGNFVKIIKASREINFVVKLAWHPEGVQIVCMDSYNTCGLESVVRMSSTQKETKALTTIKIENCEKTLKDIEKIGAKSCNILSLAFEQSTDVRILENNTTVLASFPFIADVCRKYEHLILSSSTMSFNVHVAEICSWMLNLCLFSSIMNVLLLRCGKLTLTSTCEIGTATICRQLAAIDNCNEVMPLCNLNFNAKFAKVLAFAETNAMGCINIPLLTKSPMSIQFNLANNTLVSLILHPI